MSHKFVAELVVRKGVKKIMFVFSFFCVKCLVCNLIIVIILFCDENIYELNKITFSKNNIFFGKYISQTFLHQVFHIINCIYILQLWSDNCASFMQGLYTSKCLKLCKRCMYIRYKNVLSFSCFYRGFRQNGKIR